MKNRGHVLLVLEATIGGTRRHLRDLALGLAARGWRVDVAYSPLRDPCFVDDLPLFGEAGIGCHEIRMHRGFAPIADLVAVVRLRALARRLRPDVIHCHSTKAGLVGRLAACGLGAKVLYTPHCFAFEMDSSFRGLYRLIERILVPLADRLVAVCEDEARLARGIGYRPERVRVVYNGIDASGVVRDVPKSREIVFIGRAARQKGLDILLEAYRRLLEKRPGARLSVMSDVTGALRAGLLEAGAELVPFGSQRESAAFLASGSILAMPSRWEAFPYLLLEAMAAGVPVVASEAGGVREAVRDGEEGVLIPPEAPGALAEALLRLLDSPAERDRLGRAGREAVKTWTLGRMVASIEEVYRR